VITEMTSVLPPNIREAIRSATPLGRFGTVEQVADAVAFFCANEAAYVTGQVVGGRRRLRDDVRAGFQSAFSLRVESTQTARARWDHRPSEHGPS